MFEECRLACAGSSNEETKGDRPRWSGVCPQNVGEEFARGETLGVGGQFLESEADDDASGEEVEGRGRGGGLVSACRRDGDGTGPGGGTGLVVRAEA